jgi:hypothetical protein
MNVRVDAAGGEDPVLAGDDLVDGPIASPGVTWSWMSGLPALPIAQMRPSLTPTSAFTTPQ